MNRADMKSKNMNYRFNVEYYKDLKYIYYIGQKNHDEEKKADEQELKKRDNEIENFELTSESTLEGRVLRSSNNNGIYIVGCQMPEDNPAIMEYVAGKLEKQKKSPRH